MRNVLLIVLGIIGVLSNIPYILDVLKGKTKPNLASWSTWTLLNIIIIVSALAAGGATNTVALGVAFLAGSSTVLTIALFKGTRKYTMFDGICQFIAILGVILWQVTSNPNAAIMLVIVVDVFAIIPTFRHAILHPHEETWITYCLSGLLAFAFAALATERSFAALAITLESGFINLLLVGTILYQGSRQPIKKTSS